MKRREFMAMAGAAGLVAAALPRLALAQAARKIPRVALIAAGVPVNLMTIGGDRDYTEFLTQLARNGFVEGQTVIYERYLVPDDKGPEMMPAIVASAPDLMFFGGARGAGLAAKALTKTIPMMVWLNDLLALGFVDNLARPGGNITGLNGASGPEEFGKVIGILGEAVPTARRIAFIASGADGKLLAPFQQQFDSASAATTKLGGSLVPVLVQAGDTSEANYARAFQTMVANRIDAIDIGSDETNKQALPIIAKLALAAKLPAITRYDSFVESGGLLSYGFDNFAQDKQAADQIALILKGAKPGDLPVQQPTVYLFKVNLKTAAAIGVTIPPSVLIQATQVIS